MSASGFLRLLRYSQRDPEAVQEEEYVADSDDDAEVPI
jgi:hypothetical protein